MKTWNIAKGSKELQSWVNDCKKFPIPAFTQPQYNGGSVIFKASFTAVKVDGPSKLWEDTWIWEGSSWCAKQKVALSRMENDMLKCYPAPIGMTTELKIYRDFNLKTQHSNWWYDNNCVPTNAYIAIEYKMPARVPGDVDSILRDQCFAKNYVNTIQFLFKGINQGVLNAKHSVPHEHYNGIFKSYTYSCTHYQVNCQNGNLYHKNTNERCDSPNPFKFDDLSGRQLKDISNPFTFDSPISSLGDSNNFHDEL